MGYRPLPAAPLEGGEMGNGQPSLVHAQALKSGIYEETLCIPG